MAKALNCPMNKTFDADSGAHGAASAEDGSEICYESQSEAEVFATSSEGSVFPSSDEAALVAQPQKRGRYALRSTERLTFLGQPVCRVAFQRLLGVGSSSIDKVRRGERAFTNESRAPQQKHPTFGFTLRGEVNQKWTHVVMFLYHLYQFESEAMPNYFAMVGEKTLETQFPDEAGDVDQDVVERLVNGLSQMLSAAASDVDVNMIGPGTFRGQVKKLPHQNRTELYWEFVAWSESRGLEAASYSTFMRVAAPILGPRCQGHLRFRKVGEHAQCDTCYTLRKEISKAKTVKGQEEARKRHHHHVLAAWLCRHVYWSLRALSQSTFAAVFEYNARYAWSNMSAATCVLCCIIDGMDQAKFKLPRCRTRAMKLFTKLWRPRLRVSACWCHGSSLNWFVADEDCKKNSAAQCEQIQRSLDMVLQRFEHLPAGLAVQMDNTPREGKNQHFMGYLCLLASLGVFRWTQANFLPVGHSCPAWFQFLDGLSFWSVSGCHAR